MKSMVVKWNTKQLGQARYFIAEDGAELPLEEQLQMSTRKCNKNSESEITER